MEGERAWVFTAPAFGPTHAPPHGPAAGIYCPAGWRKRIEDDVQRSSKRQRRQHGPAAVAAVAAGTGTAQPRAASVPGPPANPAQLVPLRCNWPHPAVLELLVQQCWPAAGAAALATANVPPLPPSRQWWNRMLPSLSLAHAPLPPEQQLLLRACASCSPGCGGSSAVQAEQQLPRPNVVVGYEDDWLEVAAEVLPMWQATPLAPFAGPKPLLHYLVCPEKQLALAQEFLKDVGSVYETCNLGSHVPADSAAVHTFSSEVPPGSAGSSGGSGVSGRAPSSSHPATAWSQLTATARYLAGLRHACEQLQRQLLLDPPAELQEQQGSRLEDGAEAAVAVYVVCPLEGQADLVAALVEAAACLAPCTALGAVAGPADDLCMPHSDSGLELGGPGQPVAPCEPQQPDRPAGATPAADTSRAPGGSLPPDEEQPDEPAGQQQQGQQVEGDAQQQCQQRYHGAAQAVHCQQQGDFRSLPVQPLKRPAGSRPINIVLQIVSVEALADISGVAARCTAFALYSKVQHHILPDGQGQVVAAGADGSAPASLPFCSQPLLALATAAPGPAGKDVQQQDRQAQGQFGCSTSAQRMLHCCYRLPPAGSSLLPLAFTDSCGELLHAELLDTAGAAAAAAAAAAPAAAASLRMAADPKAAGGSHAARTSSACTASLACRLVLQRCLELLGTLRAATTPPNLLHSMAIAGVDMQQAERQAWQQLLHGGTQLSQLPAGAEVAVVDLRAAPPARYAGPDPPTGCKLLLMGGLSDEGDRTRAYIAWLPAASSACSLLPREHDAVRMLQLALVCRRRADGELPAGSGSSQDCLLRLAGELHALGWLHAAFQSACLRTVAGGGLAAAADAHLPIHAALAGRLIAMLAEVRAEPSL